MISVSTLEAVDENAQIGARIHRLLLALMPVLNPEEEWSNVEIPAIIFQLQVIIKYNDIIEKCIGIAIDVIKISY